MPVYDYECQKNGCGHQFTEYLSLDDPEPKKCPKCKSTQIQKVITKAPKIMGRKKQ